MTRSDSELAVIRRPAPLPAQRAPIETLGGRHRLDPAGTELRDRLTRVHLQTAAERPEPGEVIGFHRRWWDGAARVPSLVVRLSTGQGHRRCRLVEAGGHVVALPCAGWRARRALRQLRRPAVPDPALLLLAAKGGADPRLDGRPRVTLVPPPIAPGDDLPRGRPSRPAMARRIVVPLVVVEQHDDAVRCPEPNCAGLVPIPPPGRITVQVTRCSRCGRG